MAALPFEHVTSIHAEADRNVSTPSRFRNSPLLTLAEISRTWLHIRSRSILIDLDEAVLGIQSQTVHMFSESVILSSAFRVLQDQERLSIYTGCEVSSPHIVAYS